MPPITTDFGEKYWTRNDVRGVTFTFTLFNQSSDGLGESSDEADITTEPTGSSYSRQTDTVSFNGFGDGTHGVDNDSTMSFDTSDSSETVDHVAFIADDINATARLLHIAPLNDTRDLSNFAEITIEPGLATCKVD